MALWLGLRFVLPEHLELAFSLIGFGMKHLNFSTPFLKYAYEAVEPFYNLHQTVIFFVGYFVVQWTRSDMLKFLFIQTFSFLISIGIYEFLVR